MYIIRYRVHLRCFSCLAGTLYCIGVSGIQFPKPSQHDLPPRSPPLFGHIVLYGKIIHSSPLCSVCVYCIINPIPHLQALLPAPATSTTYKWCVAWDKSEQRNTTENKEEKFWRHPYLIYKAAIFQAAYRLKPKHQQAVLPCLDATTTTTEGTFYPVQSTLAATSPAPSTPCFV